MRRNHLIWKVVVLGTFLINVQLLRLNLLLLWSSEDAVPGNRSQEEASLINLDRPQSQLNEKNYQCVRKKDMFGMASNSTLENWVHQLEMKAPNIPFKTLYEKRALEEQLFPCIFDIKIANEGVWQRFEISGLRHVANLWLYSAYLDNRPAVDGSAIRIYAAASEPDLGRGIFCHIWFANLTKPISVAIHSWHYLGFSDSVLPQGDDGLTPHPMQLNCLLPKKCNSEVPYMVSLVNSPFHRATNALRVNYFRPTKPFTKREIGVCAKNLHYPTSDLSLKLIQWLEMLRELEASKVFIYYMGIHPNMKLVLDHYVSKGFLEAHYSPLPGDQPSKGFYQHLQILHRANSHIRLEKIVQNDCFMRNVHNFRYIAVIDVDEVVMPEVDKDWVDLIQNLDSEALIRGAGITFKHAYYFGSDEDRGNLSRSGYIFKSSIRSSVPISEQNKTFIRTDLPLTLSTHIPQLCLSGEAPVPCYPQFLDFAPPSYAHLAHFRQECSPDLSEELCKEQKTNVMSSTKLLQYKEKVLRRANRVSSKLGLGRYEQ